MKVRTKLICFAVTVMAAVSFVAAGLSILLLYRTAISEQRSRLIETVKSQARLMEAITRFNMRSGAPDGPGKAADATLRRMTDAHEHNEGFGETGEFTLARRDGDSIVFLLSHRHFDLDNLKPVPFDSALAEPMRRALLGQSGTVVGLDYRGERVFAAYEPVADLNWGIVAKIDLAEIRAPFVRAGAIAAAGALFVILGGAALSVSFSNPLLRRLEESEAHNRIVLASACDPVITIDSFGLIQSASASVERVLGWKPGDLIGKNVKVLMPEPHHSTHDEYLANYRRTGESDIFDRTREFEAAHKDGTPVQIELSVSQVDVPGLQDPLFTGILHNITDRKREEEVLRRSEERFHRIFDYSNDAILVIDPLRDEILDANPTSCNMLGYTRGELLSTPVSVIHPTEMAKLRAFAESVFQKGHGWTDELRIRAEIT